MPLGSKRVVALIPARGGSKGIPRKNLAPLAGKPLLAYSIEAGLGSRFVDEVIVSSDDESILEAAQTLGATALRRPANLAEDTTPTAPVIAHFIEACEVDAAQTWIVLLQPTSPLRTTEHVDAAFEQLIEGGEGETLISVCIPDESPYKSFICDSAGFLRGLVDDEAPFRPRQELPTAYQPNGAIYIFDAEAFLRDGRIPMRAARPYVMDLATSIDIDVPPDLARAAAQLKQEE